MAKCLQGNVAIVGIGECFGLSSDKPCAKTKTPSYQLILLTARPSGQKYLCHTDKVAKFQFVRSIANNL